MKISEIKSCYIGPEISPEQFIPEHFFLYLAVGEIEGHDGHKMHFLKAGDYCIVRKNHLAKYNKQKYNGKLEKVVVVFDEDFLAEFKKNHNIINVKSDSKSSFFLLEKDALVPNFINSLMPYYNEGGTIDETFSKVKREELLLILLQTNPEISSVLFDHSIPEKLDLEAFVYRNYKFNVSLERLAYLTGRSLSSFKRDFKKIFNDTPNHWLMQKRLQEAHFQIEKERKKPSDIYLDLGFENISHFSFAFKKQFGYNPTSLIKEHL
ncbi:AraC family transcriptional regulator [Flavobacterium sp. LS1R49]|uniref:AraC family transcriptional regulator n=1 Tax=Flavobacterium shii TaxID=2987687 RepID=A0A9X3BX33_9FLAO|nr:AraC family transcriptional regulator [Flavobacterium shii]MCV9926560.1 AraC family transcriptional regulator [Flavobacterium shii]